VLLKSEIWFFKAATNSLSSWELWDVVVVVAVCPWFFDELVSLLSETIFLPVLFMFVYFVYVCLFCFFFVCFFLLVCFCLCLFMFVYFQKKNLRTRDAPGCSFKYSCFASSYSCFDVLAASVYGFLSSSVRDFLFYFFKFLNFFFFE